MGRKKVIKNVVERKKTIQNDEQKNNRVKERRITSVVMLLSFLAVFVVGISAWYARFYGSDEELKIKNPSNGKTETDKDVYTLVNQAFDYEKDMEKRIPFYAFDKYVVSGIWEKLYKIFDVNGNVLEKFEDPIEHTNLYEKDGLLYIENIVFSDAGTETLLSLSVYDGKNLKSLYNQSAVGMTHTPILSKINDEYKLLAYYLEKNDDSGGEIYFVDTGEVVTYSKGRLISAEPVLSVDDAFVTYSDKYVVILDSDTSKYGLIDITTGKYVISADYDALYPTYDGNYIAKKNGKTGIIDRKLKKIVNFEYDFIDRNDNFYVVGKDNKLAIMNEKYEFVTDFEFEHRNASEHPYTYVTCCNNFNTFKAYKVNDKYILINNVGIDEDNAGNVYIIGEDGKYETILQDEMGVIEANNFVYTYLVTEKKVTIYDEFIKVKHILSFENYDLDEDDRVFVDLIGDVIQVKLNDSVLYYDYETGKEIETPKVSYEIGNIKIDVNLSNYRVNIYNNDKLELETNIESIYDIKKLSNGNYLLITEDGLTFVVKS